MALPSGSLDCISHSRSCHSTGSRANNALQAHTLSRISYLASAGAGLKAYLCMGSCAAVPRKITFGFCPVMSFPSVTTKGPKSSPCDAWLQTGCSMRGGVPDTGFMSAMQCTAQAAGYRPHVCTMCSSLSQVTLWLVCSGMQRSSC